MYNNNITVMYHNSYNIVTTKETALCISINLSVSTTECDQWKLTGYSLAKEQSHCAMTHIVHCSPVLNKI